MADESPEEFLVRTCPPYRAMLERYPKCIETLHEEERRDLDEALYDPWGNS